MRRSGQGLSWGGDGRRGDVGGGGEESPVDPWSGVTDSPASW